MREGLLGENRERRVVSDFAVFDYTAMAVVGIFAKTDVGDDEKIELGFFDAFDGALYNAGCGERTRAGGVFCFGQAEQNYGRNTERGNFAALFHDLIDGLLINAGHGTDFLANLAARAD